MREQSDRADRSLRTIEQCREFFTLSVSEIEALGRHDEKLPVVD
jgi:hypothetical protein